MVPAWLAASLCVFCLVAGLAAGFVAFGVMPFRRD